MFSLNHEETETRNIILSFVMICCGSTAAHKLKQLSQLTVCLMIHRNKAWSVLVYKYILMILKSIPFALCRIAGSTHPIFHPNRHP